METQLEQAKKKELGHMKEHGIRHSVHAGSLGLMYQAPPAMACLHWPPA